MMLINQRICIALLSLFFCTQATSYEIRDLKIVSDDPAFLDRGLAKSHWFNEGKSGDYSYLVVEDPTDKAPSKLVERFELRHGDCRNRKNPGKSLEGDCNTGRQRIEIGVDKLQLKSKSNFNKKNSSKEFWYGWSIYFPEDYVSVPQYVTPYLGQFHARNKGERVVMPVITFVETSGVYRANGSAIADKDELRGRWHKVELHVRWSETNDGFIRIYANGNEIFSLENSATTTREQVTFKYGIYRGKEYSLRYPENYEWPTQVVYFSNVKKALSREGLNP